MIGAGFHLDQRTRSAFARPGRRRIQGCFRKSCHLRRTPRLALDPRRIRLTGARGCTRGATRFTLPTDGVGGRLSFCRYPPARTAKGFARERSGPDDTFFSGCDTCRPAASRIASTSAMSRGHPVASLAPMRSEAEMKFTFNPFAGSITTSTRRSYVASQLPPGISVRMSTPTGARQLRKNGPGLVKSATVRC